MILLMIALGGAIGAVTRYQLSSMLQPASPEAFPWGTFLINVSGSLLLAFIYRYVDGTSQSAQIKALAGIGFCGAFTTFSTFSYETVQLLSAGAYGRAGTYVVASVLLSIAGTVLGFRLATAMLPGSM